MISSPDSILICPACAGPNAPDSKFCRHCGHALQDANAVVASGLPVSVASETLSPAGELEMADDVLPSVVATEAVAEAGGAVDAETMSSPGEIDARRARHMLDRAQGLSERGDHAGAILACRQAIVLAPAVAGGQAMLGALLERTGDLPLAMQAFEKAAQMAPESGAARDLARLRDKMGVPTENAPVFHFDDAELFGGESAKPTTAPLAAPVALADSPASALETVVANAAASEVDTAAAVAIAPATPNPEPAVSGADAGAIPVAVVSAPPVVVMREVSDAAPTVAAMGTVAGTLLRERRVADIPVRVERRIGAAAGVSSLGTPIGARVKAPTVATTVNPLLLVDSHPKSQGMNAVWGRSSYFGRSLPLVGATILSLGFLSWARGLADARNLASAPVVGPVVAVVQTSEGAPAVAPVAPVTTSSLPALAPVGSAPANNGGFPISNQPITAPVVTPPPTTPNVAPSAPVARVAPPAAPTQRRVARGVPSLPPASISSLGPVRPAPPNRSNNGGLTLPPPILTDPGPAAPPTSVLPGSGAGALNPAGSPGNGYVRITRGRVGAILPQRPAGRAGDAERAAATAARGGSTTQAIDGLTNAINANASDAGYRFQQRAMLFLTQGDYGRAADDFNSAISAYNDQIARGEQVASARAGLSAARSGLNRAMAGGR